MPVSILLYDDNDSIRYSIHQLLNNHDEFEILCDLPNAETVMSDIETFRPDVVLMDIDMPIVNGIKALINIRSRFPDLPVIMSTVFDDDDHILEAICAGANGYILKRDLASLPESIESVLRGGAPMTSSVAKKVLQLVSGQFRPFKKSIELLTPKEIEIVHKLAEGLSYKLIASQLQITIETVRSHIKKIYKKLEVNSALEAVNKLKK